GVIDFYKTCQAAGFKPILGCEVYVAPRAMSDRTPRIDDNMYHLVLLAENNEGYHNLLSLVSLGFTEGFYYKPRVDKEALARHSKGIIALSGCIAGEVAAKVLAGEPDQARQSAAFYQDIFGAGNYYLEIQDHGFAEQKTANRELLKIHRETGIPLVASDDVHYINRSDAYNQDVLMAIQMGKNIDDPSRMKFHSEELYMKSPEEMQLLFGDNPQSLSNTLEIGDRCQVDIDFGKYFLPHYTVPEGYSIDSYLNELCFRGAGKIYGQISQVVKERLDFELEVIKQMGYSAYFLIVWDFIHYAKNQGIAVGPGRGSAAGSLVAYTLGITNIDPLKYGLLFERFLNPERVSMPDIDIDFCFERRGEVINYVVQKYGADKVAQIITFGTMAARAAIKDVGRALNMPYGDVDKVAKMVPMELQITIDKSMKDVAELRELYAEEPAVKKLIDTASALEGMPRHASTHAAGLVITQEPLTHYVPLYKASDGPVTTQFSMETVESLGLLKMDLLGLRTLTVIGDALRIIEESTGVEVDIEGIPMDDQLTYEMLSRGETAGVFQLESSGMRAILKDLKPEVFEDIVALVALYRPGPLGSGMVDDFIKNKHGITNVKYLHPKLEPILKDTYGVILYQEQVMYIASMLAGFSLGEADLLRRAMGKKKPEIIAGLRKQFMDGADENDVDRKIAGQVFDLMEYFAGYGFNKSHSAAYAMISYQTAYLKANYTVQYMAALITSVNDNSAKVSAYIEECRRKGIEVLPPDVNESKQRFSVVENKIRFGMAALKNVGLGAVEAIISERDNGGMYKDYTDFCQRIDARAVNRRVIESLIKCGAFDSLGHKRSQLMAVVDEGLGIAQQSQRDRVSGQLTLLDFLDEEYKQEVTIKLPAKPEYPKNLLLTLEKETLGLYISGHPLSQYRPLLQRLNTATAVEITELPEQSPVLLAGMISGIKRITTRKGDAMAFMNLEDLTGTLEILVFPRIFEQVRPIMNVDAAVLIKGKVSGEGEDVKVICEEMTPLEDHLNGELHINIDNSSEMLDQIQILLRNYPGRTPVFFHVKKEKRVFKAGEEYWADLTKPVVMGLADFLGAENVAIKRIPEEQEQQDSAQELIPELTQEVLSGAIVDNIPESAGMRKRSAKEKKRKFPSLLEL
ncbi:MAG: DNA polymerase III subunit alpha, partial [Peptococcaceae bacterium]|nr:DNA polymerase III subunit alpha [Peptococcaceae bacterium]